jgi:hypothetical protein
MPKMTVPAISDTDRELAAQLQNGARARQQAGDIYRAASKAVVYDGDDTKFDLEVVEHILRAVLEVLTPEQRAQILKKVSL